MEFTETHGEALRLAVKALREIQASSLSDSENYAAAANTIESDLLPDEEKWEEENGFRSENGTYYPNGDAPEVA